MQKETKQVKQDDKKRSHTVKGKTFRSTSFDLQVILTIYHTGDDQIYYKHKLNVFNFTVHDASSVDGYSFVWDEAHGSKGSIEIGSCLLKYSLNLPETVRHVVSFFDISGGKYRNKFVVAAMLPYLETNSMHSTIESYVIRKSSRLVNGVH